MDERVGSVAKCVGGRGELLQAGVERSGLADWQTLAAGVAAGIEVVPLGGALTDQGDLLLYGCDVAGGNGAAFVAALATATEADVAASTDRTGSFAAGRNWVLEAGIGNLETSSMAFQGYAHAWLPLPPPPGTIR